MLLSGALTSAFGWEVIFYVLGSFLVIWFGVWVLLCHGSPEEHPRISDEEKEYIMATTVTQGRDSPIFYNST
jgi:hypothetical protein